MKTTIVGVPTITPTKKTWNSMATLSQPTTEVSATGFASARETEEASQRPSVIVKAVVEASPTICAPKPHGGSWDPITRLSESSPAPLKTQKKGRMKTPKADGLFIDLETGGLSPHRHGTTQIVAIAFAVDPTRMFGEGKLEEVDRLHIKVQPVDYMEYDRIALEMQGETAASLMQEGKTEGDALGDLWRFADKHLDHQFGGRIWAHEASFDWSFIRAMAVRTFSPGYLPNFSLAQDRINWTCSKHLFRSLKQWGVVPHDQKENLRYIAEYYNLEFPERDHHRPLKDTEIALVALDRIMADFAFYLKGQ